MTHSELWGQSGELWRPDGRLPDFSCGGYHRGDEAITEPAVVSSVTDFGAKGDGEHDDTQAFRDALADTPAGAVRVPPGGYIISAPLKITRGGIVLRGAGAGESTLHFPTPLDDLDPRPTNTAHGRPTTAYSWSGGFVSIEGARQTEPGVAITAPAKRGDTSVSVSNAASFRVGQRVDITVRDDAEQTLARYLYAGDPDDIANFTQAAGSFLTVVTDATPSSIAFDRPLRFDLRPEWQPHIRAFEPAVNECGIEGLSFDFPVTPYEGHFTERGHNAISLSAVADCWVRDVAIHSADSGVFLGGHGCTVSDIAFHSRRPEWKGATGHHGITLGGTDNHFTRFRFHTVFLHDITVTGGSSGNVSSCGSGKDMNFDHHRRAPYENLFSDIDVGKGTRLWSSGGGPALGRHCGAGETFWNIRAASPLEPPPADWGPSLMNLVGLETDCASATSRDGLWLEALAPEGLQPRDLYEAQRSRRLDSPAARGEASNE